MNCIICNSKNLKNIGSINGYVKEDAFDIFECSDCDVSFSDPHISKPDIYNLIYKYSDITPGYDRYSIFRDKILKVKNPLKYLAKSEYMYYALFSFLKNNNIKNKNILEVGCGMGYLTYALNKSGHNAVGIDISINAIQKAKQNYPDYKDKYVCDNFFNIDIKDEHQKYDIICMLEMIEHVDDPIKYIDKALSLLKKGGYLYISTPDKDFKNTKSIWMSDAPEVHMTLFSERTIIKMLETHKDVKVSFLKDSCYNFLHDYVFVNKNSHYVSNPRFTRNGEILFDIYKKTKKRELLEFLHIDYYYDRFSMIFRNLFLFVCFVFTDKYEIRINTNPTMAFVVKK